MIAANELKIGNWVIISGEYIKVENIDETGINCNVSGGYYAGDFEREYDGTFEDWKHWSSGKQIEPISLTPDILEKAGFETDDTTFWIEYSIDGQVLWIHLGYFAVGIFKHLPDNRISIQGIEVNSVHQLQNLYFALTGNELTINL